jgi:hypothetical protein
MYYYALEASHEIAKEFGESDPRRGAYSAFEGSPISKGELQFDMWGVTPSSRWEWDVLKEEVKKHGVRNSLLLAPMPTASTSQILGNNECFEPYTSNIYSRRVLSGEFAVVNKHLLRDLVKLGMWNDALKNKIIAANGSVQNIPEIPQYISCETECFSENQKVNEADVLATLNSLYEVGYRKFKLVDQQELAGLEPGLQFYGRPAMNLLSKAMNKIISRSNYRLVKLPNREFLSTQHRFYFPFGSTGPFGEKAPGKWMNYETAKKCLLRHRSDFFSMEKNPKPYTIWCDWHATI